MISLPMLMVFGTSIEAFAKRLVTESILTGHAATLVDFSSDRTGAEPGGRTSARA